ncbi:MAG: glycoside hydrolase family 3 N-terminal domain-containing protein, partial [Gemmatimonadaceae bacterium]
METIRRMALSLALMSSVATLACAPGSSGAPATAINDQARARLIGAAHPGATTALGTQDSAWVELSLRAMSPRQRIAQLIMPWVPGEYAAVGSPEYEQVRSWVEDDKVGGLILSMGLPHSYAAKLNHMQHLASVPLLVASDMENGTGMRLGGSYALPSLLPQGGGTVFPPVMALGATGSPDLAYQ